MFVRVTTIDGASDLDAGVAIIRKSVSELEAQKGFRGVSASGNPSTGNVGIISVWDTLADLEASESSVSKLRQEAAAKFGGQATVAVFEEMVNEMGDQPPGEGCALRLFETSMDPAKVDELNDFFRSTVLPQVQAAPGFRAARNMIDRKTGKGFSATVWADEAALAADEAKAGDRRAAAKAAGVTLGPPIYRTILFSHFV